MNFRSAFYETGAATVRLPAGAGDLTALGDAGRAPVAIGLNVGVAGEPRPERDSPEGRFLALSLQPYEVAVFAAGIDVRPIDYRPPGASPKPSSRFQPPPRSVADLPQQSRPPDGVTWSRTPKTRLAVPVLPTAPQIDGDLSDPAWDLAAPLGPLTTSAGTSTPSAATAVSIGQRDGRLYLASSAYEPLLDSLVTHRHAAWRNDCIEVFLDPDNRRTSFAHLIGTSHGRLETARTVQDEWGEGERDERWDPEVSFRAGRAAGAWTAELSIALADLGDAASSPVWGFDVARERKPGGGENSVWTTGRFKAAGQFGEIALSPAEVTLASGTLRNRSTQPIDARVEVLVSAHREAERYPTWEDQWTELARQTVEVRVPGARGGKPGISHLITPDMTSRVPDGGRLRLSLLTPGPRQSEELIANPVVEETAED